MGQASLNDRLIISEIFSQHGTPMKTVSEGSDGFSLEDHRLETPFLVPSWLVSVAVHVVVGILLITQMKSCGAPASMGTATDWREVGIYIPDNVTTEVVPEEDSQDDNQSNDAANSESQPMPNESKPDAPPPIPSTLPKENALNVLGSGQRPVSQFPNETVETIQQLQNAQRPRGLAPPPGTVRFFNILAEGRSYLFLIDMSDSMAAYHAFHVAKNEVLAGLSNLNSDQQFQVIFYNDSYSELKNRKGRAEMHWANDPNITLARNFVSEKASSGGTDHYPALSKALAYGADVIFFLTDAAEPALRPRELDAIKRKNNGRAEIHCVEFGVGGDLGLENFLRKLARQNGGSYRYRDVRRFGKQ